MLRVRAVRVHKDKQAHTHTRKCAYISAHTRTYVCMYMYVQACSGHICKSSSSNNNNNNALWPTTTTSRLWLIWHDVVVVVVVALLLLLLFCVLESEPPKPKAQNAHRARQRARERGRESGRGGVAKPHTTYFYYSTRLDSSPAKNERKMCRKSLEKREEKRRRKQNTQLAKEEKIHLYCT